MKRNYSSLSSYKKNIKRAFKEKNYAQAKKFYAMYKNEGGKLSYRFITKRIK